MITFRTALVFVAPLTTLLLGACTTFDFQAQSNARLPSGRYIHIPLVSTSEDNMMREATERASTLHSQLRAFDTANRVVENRIKQLRAEQLSQQGLRRGKSKVAGSSQIAKSTLFDVRFAKGATDISKDIQANLVSVLSSGEFSAISQSKGVRSHLVLQVATHRRMGLDSVSVRRLGSIHEFLKANKIPSESVKLKIVRVVDDAIPSKLDGSASRTIKVSAVQFDQLKL